MKTTYIISRNGTSFGVVDSPYDRLFRDKYCDANEITSSHMYSEMYKLMSHAIISISCDPDTGFWHHPNIVAYSNADYADIIKKIIEDDDDMDPNRHYYIVKLWNHQ